MAVKNDIHNVFVCTNSAAVDPASLAANTAVNQDMDVETLDGSDESPLKSTDYVVAIPPVDLEADIVVQSTVYKDANTVTVRFGNPSAGAVDMASQAAGDWKFLVYRR